MSSNVCSCPTASTSVAGTLTGGIQDIAALLPLLGTEQCEDHVSSALTKGYLYAAASPMSLFGSLGLARAGLKTFLASFSIPAWNVVGARTLSNMGFRPQGLNLSLIMVDPDDNERRYLVETRLDKLVEELHIDKTKIQDVRHKTIGWNVRMMALSALLCLLSIAPYVFLNVKTQNSLPHHTRWTFPALRAAGGFLTTTMMQFIIQMRITILTRRWISKHGTSRFPQRRLGPFRDPPFIIRTGLRTLHRIIQSFRCYKTFASRIRDGVEIGLNVTVTDGNTPLTWFFLALLLLGVLASVVGYVGCFSVVQSAHGSTGPLSWLCLEAGLSLLRTFLWGYNPACDDAPPLELILTREPHPPLPTCKLYDHDIKREKILPLTRANQFLNSVTSFTGVAERFDHPDVTLYYTLTWNAVSRANSHDTMLDEPGEHVLYITVFDHKERANTRVYTQSGGIEHFYATESSLPVIDPKQGLLEVKLWDEIDDPDDPIISDPGIRSKLSTHYRSIMDQLHFAMGQSTWNPTYMIENRWTMAMIHTTSTPHRRAGNVSEPNPKMTVSIRDFHYLLRGRLEKTCQSLCSARGEWIAIYMHLEIRELREGFMLNRVDEAKMGKAKAEGKRKVDVDETEIWDSSAQMRFDKQSGSEDVETQVMDGIRRMELLLVKEMEIWEAHLRGQAINFIGRDDVLEKARLMKEWELGFRIRLDADIREMEARFNVAEQEVKTTRNDELMGKWQSRHDEISKAWQVLAQRYVDKPPPSPLATDLSDLEHLQVEYQRSAEDIEANLVWSQPTAAQQERLRQLREITIRSMDELQQAVFWMDNVHGLTEYKLSRSRWLLLDVRRFINEPLEVSHAHAMDNVIFVTFDYMNSDNHYARVAELIRDWPSVTSIYVPDSHRLPAIQRDPPLFVNDRSGSNEIETFLRDNPSQLERTHHTHLFIDTGGFYHGIRPTRLTLSPGPGSKIAVSFFGPRDGNLTLKLTHWSHHNPVTLILKESPGSTRTFQYIVPLVFTTTTITLSPSPSSDHPSFQRGTRNNLIIQIVQGDGFGYTVQDIRLQDEAGNECNADNLDSVET